MPIKEVTYYQGSCDGCLADLHEGAEYSAWADDASVMDQARDADWLIAGQLGKHPVLMCDNCQPNDRTDEQDDCDHAELEPTGREREWSCPACGLTVGQPVFKVNAGKRLAEHRAQVSPA